MKPRLNEPRTMRYGKVRGAQAVAVAALGEKVELGGDLCLLERLKVEERVLFVDRVVFGLEEKGWRGVGGRVDTVRQFVESRSVGEIAGVDDDGEIGAGVAFINGSPGSFVVGVIAGAAAEGATTWEARHAHAFGCDSP